MPSVSSRVSEDDRTLNRELATLISEDRMLKAVEMHLAGATTGQIAEAMQVTDRSVRRWLKMPAAQSVIAEAHMASVRKVVHMTGIASAQAVRTLMDGMTNAPRWADRIRAAEALLRSLGMNQLAESMHDTASADREIRQVLADRLGDLASRAKGVVIEARTVEPTPDEPTAKPTKLRDVSRGTSS